MTGNDLTRGGLSRPPVRSTLSRAYIARAALALIDAGGLAKFSMRKLGAALGTAAAPELALQIIRCLREYTIGHALNLAVLRLGAQDRSEMPAPGTREYNLLAEADDHFEPGLTAMLDGFEHRLAPVEDPPAG